MANTMLSRPSKSASSPAPSANMQAQFRQFSENIRKSGKNPKDILNELVSSGKVSREQLEKATAMARMFAGKLK